MMNARAGNDGRWRHALRLAVLALCLLAPSIWMLAKVPPLWRDADAYNQIVPSPGRATAGGHGPLYSMAVRLPLYLGYRMERARGTVTDEAPDFYHAPLLTDTGIYLLITAQHLALCGAALALVISVSRVFWMRLALALFFASNHLFYTFAHCVGSESLSMICILLFATVGLRLVKNVGRLTWKAWSLFAAVLLACLLTRYANLLLALALPLAFLLSAARARRRPPLRLALLAFAVAIGCVWAAHGVTEAVCRAEKLPYFSKIGFTFLWRVGFLESLPEAQRTALLDRVATRTKSPDGQRLVALLREMLHEGVPLQAEPVSQRLRLALFPPETKVRPRRVHYALNDVALAFLRPPTAAHWRAAHKDFAEICRITLPLMSSFLFVTTTYYWAHPNELPQCARLSTFRNDTPESMQAIPMRLPYFQWWRTVSLNGALAAWLGATLVMLFANWKREPRLAVSCFYSIALVCVGLAMIEMTALIGQLIPRYSLPLWELLWISLMIYAGAVADAFSQRKDSPKPLPD